jgi:inner membrane transporter RhtA
MSTRSAFGAPAGALMIVAACAILQGAAALAVPLVGTFGSGATAALRLSVAGLFLLLLYRPKAWKWGIRLWCSTALFGLAIAGMNGLFYAAIARIPLGLTVAIEFVGPLVVAALATKRRKDLLWVALAAAAVVVLGLDGKGLSGAPLDILGLLFAVAAGACWAVYILVGRRISTRIAGHGALAVATCVGALVLAPTSLGQSAKLLADPTAVVTLLGVAVLGTVIPYSLQFSAMRRLSSRTYGVLASLEPVIAAIAGWVFLVQALTLMQMIAIAVIVAASLAATASDPRAQQRAGQAGEDDQESVLVESPKTRRGPE